MRISCDTYSERTYSQTLVSHFSFILLGNGKIALTYSDSIRSILFVEFSECLTFVYSVYYCQATLTWLDFLGMSADRYYQVLRRSYKISFSFERDLSQYTDDRVSTSTKTMKIHSGQQCSREYPENSISTPITNLFLIPANVESTGRALLNSVKLSTLSFACLSYPCYRFPIHHDFIL